MASKEENERLTAMITAVVTPSMRARIKYAEDSLKVPYSYIVRWSLQKWLDDNDVPKVEPEDVK